MKNFDPIVESGMYLITKRCKNMSKHAVKYWKNHQNIAKFSTQTVTLVNHFWTFFKAQRENPTLQVKTLFWGMTLYCLSLQFFEMPKKNALQG